MSKHAGRSLHEDGRDRRIYNIRQLPNITDAKSAREGYEGAAWHRDFRKNEQNVDIDEMVKF